MKKPVDLRVGKTKGAVAQNMHIGKNSPVWENLTFRHSGRALGPESIVFIE